MPSAVGRQPGPVSDRYDVDVHHLGGDCFTVRLRGHEVDVDQPRAAGGRDTGPTPTELFVGALASCVAFYVHRYLVRHRLPEAGLAVAASFSMADRPARVGEIAVHVTVPDGLTGEQRRALLAVATHCTVHNSLRQPPAVTVDLNDTAAAVA